MDKLLLSSSRSLADTLLESKQLLGPECLVVNLGGGFDEVLEVSPQQEIAQVNKFAVVGIFNVHNTPSVLAATNRLAIDDDIVFRSNDGEGNDLLHGKIT